jgi:hypothetical protein
MDHPRLGKITSMSAKHPTRRVIAFSFVKCQGARAMRIPGIALALFVSIAGLNAQGIVNFNNRVLADANGPAIDAPIYLTFDTDTSQFGAKVPGGQGYRAALYGAVGNLVPENALLLLTNPFTGQAAVDFRTTTATFGYVNVGTDSARVIPGADSGAVVTLQVRAWAGGYASYEEAIDAGEDEIGESNLIVIRSSETDDQEYPRLVGLQPFALTVVPEPSAWALIALGLGLLSWARRSR